jgi:hypothetical protein
VKRPDVRSAPVDGSTGYWPDSRRQFYERIALHRVVGHDSGWTDANVQSHRRGRVGVMAADASERRADTNV